MTRAQALALTHVVGLADAGRFTLPAELLNAAETQRRVRTATVKPYEPTSVDAVAAQFVRAITDDDAADVRPYARELAESEARRQEFDHAGRILVEANEQAANAATNVAADLVEKVITAHLWPALQSVYDDASRAAATLAGRPLDPGSLLDAPAKVRAAWLDLGPLTQRRAAIFEARRWANNLGHRQPQHDTEHLFAMFRKPLAFHPHWQAPARIPALPIPSDPIELLLFMVSDAAGPAEPWLPTVVEQDAAWWEQFGEAVTNRAQAAQFARGFA